MCVYMCIHMYVCIYIHMHTQDNGWVWDQADPDWHRQNYGEPGMSALYLT